MSAGDLPQTFFLGRYRVVDEIGVGGMASVHLARVDGPGGFQKWVAIKRIHPHLVEDDQFVDMFLDEARIAAGINHANVAQVFDLGKDDNTYWIAMEYLHGEPLREVMRRIEELGSRIPFHVAARVCADAAEGLHGAHELRGRNGQLLNLVHRDVTPHNLFVTYDGYTKVVDFGIAKVVDRLASTRAGTLKGKLAYMSPEQVRGQEVDRRTDIFALGVVLWELTTNRRLFRMETDLDTLEKVQACVVPLPTTLVPDYPPELQDVVMRALSQRKEERFQSAREFSRALQRFLMKQGTFVGPEDVGDYVKGLFKDRVSKRERYLEWAAEVTSAVDVEQLREAQAAADDGTPSLLHEAPAAPPAPGVPPLPQNFGGGTQRSDGQNSASAAIVTSAPLNPSPIEPDLAASSLMDEDEDIPTVVAQPRYQPEEPSRGGPRPAAGAPQAFDGAATQALDEGMGGLDSTIALPDAGHADSQVHQARAQLQQWEQQQAAPQAPSPPQQQFGGALTPAQTLEQQQQQAAIETKMSLPRPAAVAQWLMEQGDVEIQGPRSTGVIIAIAALATLCVMGVLTLIIWKVRATPRPDPSAITAPAATAGLIDYDATVAEDDPTNPTKKSGKSPDKTAANTKGERSSSSSSSGGSNEAVKAATGTLSIYCTPACTSVVAAGRSLGPSPVIGASLPPGQHRVTLESGDKKKTIMVSVTAGKLTTQNVPM